MNEYIGRMGFSYEEKEIPRIDATLYSNHEDGIDIYEYYEMCKSFARIIGYTEDTIKKVFDKDFDLV